MQQRVKTILCVDDDQDDLMMLRDALHDTSSNHTIVEAFDGLHAMELLSQMKVQGNLPCLIVLDINMPRMNGKQTLEALQNDTSYAAIPIVLFSTSSSDVDKTFSRIKQVELITKPLNVNALHAAANKMLHYCSA